MCNSIAKSFQTSLLGEPTADAGISGGFSAGLQACTVVKPLQKVETQRIPQMSGVNKLALTGPAAFGYSSTASTTRAEEFSIGTFAEASLELGVSIGASFSAGPVDGNAKVTIGGGGTLETARSTDLTRSRTTATTGKKHLVQDGVAHTHSHSAQSALHWATTMRLTSSVCRSLPTRCTARQSL